MDVRFPAFQQFPNAGAAGVGAGAAVGAGGLGGTVGAGPETAAAAGAQGADSFPGALKEALQGVSRLQDESSALQRRFLMGDEGVSLERTMMAMQKSQVAFQAALTVRNRLVAAYTDIMNMPV